MNAEQFFAELDRDEVARYQQYWGGMKPQSHAERFKRWVFALCSIRATWQQNVKSYQALTSDLSWVFDQEHLQRIVMRQSMGLHKVRLRAFWELSREFFADPGRYEKSPDFTWTELRNEYAGRLFGIGLAKTSFAMELSYPLEAEVVCLDVHILRGLGAELSTPTPTEYAFWERVWLDKCLCAGVPSPVARHMFWDKLHGKSDTRYWSQCLEGGS